MLPDVPAPLAEVFSKQITISTRELSKLLPMSSKTLEAHIRHGHIDFVDFSTGDSKPRRAFTLDQVQRFISSRSFREIPYPLRPNRRSLTPVESIWKGPNILEVVAKLETEREAKRQRQRAEWDAMKEATRIRKEAEKAARTEARAERKRVKALEKANAVSAAREASQRQHNSSRTPDAPSNRRPLATPPSPKSISTDKRRPSPP